MLLQEDGSHIDFDAIDQAILDHAKGKQSASHAFPIAPCAPGPHAAYHFVPQTLAPSVLQAAKGMASMQWHMLQQTALRYEGNAMFKTHFKFLACGKAFNFYDCHPCLHKQMSLAVIS